eukprot:m.329238 g.329238  ORF g.329238 m.329238 type:complete len:689 (-) comp20443_c0_seq3:157-2223(-)
MSTMRRALGTVTHSQANARRESYEPRRVTKKTTGPTSRQSVGAGRKSIGRPSLGPSGGSERTSLSSSGRQSIMGRGRQSMASGDTKSTASGRQSMTSRHSMGRSSVGSMSRRSSIHSTVTAVSDPRPLSDPGFRNACIRNLIQYLTANGYGHPISPKLLTSPSDKDFFRIFQFLYHKVDPNFKFESAAGSSSAGSRDRRSTMGGRADTVRASESMVEQIPILLKALGYPFKINRSAVISCGSHSNWPKMLGALHFLLDIVTLQDTVDINSQIFGSKAPTGFEEDQDDSQHNQMLFEYLMEAYHAFLHGDDDLKAELDDEMLSQFQIENDRIMEAKEQLVQQCHEHSVALEELQAGEPPLAEFSTKKEMFAADVQRFEVLIQKLTMHKEKQKAKLAEAQLEMQTKQEEKENLDAELARLNILHAQQELTPEDVKRMTTARSKLDEQLAALHQRKEDIDKRAWKFEVQLSKALESAETTIRQYNKMAEQLQLVPARSAPRARGVDYEIRLNPNATASGQPLVLEDIRNTLLPALHNLKDDTNSLVHETHSIALGHKESLNKIIEDIGDKNRAISDLEGKLEAQKAKYQQQKSEMEVAHKESMGSIDTMQDEILRMQADLSAHAAECARLRETANIELQHVREGLMRDKEAFQSVVVRTLDIVTNHKQTVQGFIAAYRSAVTDAAADTADL